MGTSEVGGAAQERLQYVDVHVVSNIICATLYITQRIVITKQMVCAGELVTGGKGVCQGDSGGPMVVNEKLFGAISFGIGCDNPLYPQVYTSIASSGIRDFIQSVTGV